MNIEISQIKSLTNISDKIEKKKELKCDYLTKSPTMLDQKRFGAGLTAVKSIRRQRIASIFQHYYPEGGWGFIILICGLIVELISYGLQQSFGIIIIFISIRFRVFDIEQVGKKNTCQALMSKSW